MKIPVLIALGASLAVPALAAPTDDELMTAPRKFIEALDKSRPDAAAALMTADATMIDEFPPFAWSGPDAFTHWLADYKALVAASPGGKVKLGDPITTRVSGDLAYVVCASSETFKVKGVRMAETARMVFALRREDGAWKIAAWTWAARKPHAAIKAPSVVAKGDGGM
jgi:hypothetical protein